MQKQENNNSLIDNVFKKASNSNFVNTALQETESDLTSNSKQKERRRKGTPPMQVVSGLPITATK